MNLSITLYEMLSKLFKYVTDTSLPAVHSTENFFFFIVCVLFHNLILIQVSSDSAVGWTCLQQTDSSKLDKLW